MENITVTITEQKIREAMEAGVAKLLKDDYNNPVRKALEDAVAGKQGEIKKVVDDIIANAINDADFKKKIADAVIVRMVDSALRK